MIGVVIGLVFSVVVFTLNPKDNKAVSQFKKKKQQQQDKKQQQAKKQKEALQKLQNDPELKKRRQESNKVMRQKLFAGLNEEDKKMLSQYMEDKKKQGKSQAEIIKQATNKAGVFMSLSLIMFLIVIFAIVMLSTQSSSTPNPTSGQFYKQFLRFIKGIYPRVGGQIGNSVGDIPKSSTQL